jgi:hypothetical protein
VQRLICLKEQSETTVKASKRSAAFIVPGCHLVAAKEVWSTSGF